MEKNPSLGTLLGGKILLSVYPHKKKVTFRSCFGIGTMAGCNMLAVKTESLSLILGSHMVERESRAYPLNPIASWNVTNWGEDSQEWRLCHIIVSMAGREHSCCVPPWMSLPPTLTHATHLVWMTRNTYSLIPLRRWSSLAKGIVFLGLEMVQHWRAPARLSREAGLSSLYPHGSSQLSVVQVPGDLTLWGLCGHQTLTRWRDILADRAPLCMK